MQASVVFLCSQQLENATHNSTQKSFEINFTKEVHIPSCVDFNMSCSKTSWSFHSIFPYTCGLLERQHKCGGLAGVSVHCPLPGVPVQANVAALQYCPPAPSLRQGNKLPAFASLSQRAACTEILMIPTKRLFLCPVAVVLYLLPSVTESFVFKFSYCIGFSK